MAPQVWTPVWIFSIWLMYSSLPTSEGRVLPRKSNCRQVLLDTVIPNLLHDMRSIFMEIKPYFQGKDNLNNLLLSSQLLEDLQSPIGCETLSEMIQFYLEEVMPQAETLEPRHKQNVLQLGEALHSLEHQLKKCKDLLPCKHRSSGAGQVKEQVSKLGQKGIVKAIAEFDIFINYLESYLQIN